MLVLEIYNYKYKCTVQNIDMIIIRENTEGEYSGLEHETAPGIVESLKV